VLTYRDLNQMLLRLGIMGLHPSKRPFHFVEHPYRVGDQIRITIALMSRDRMSLTLNPKALVENLLFPDLDSLFGRCGSAGHVIETPAQSKGSHPRTQCRHTASGAAPVAAALNISFTEAVQPAS
jgi:hypothetical protein